MTKPVTTDITEVVTSDLRALLHWAAVGIGLSNGGSHEHEIENIIESYSEHLGMKRSPKFGELR
jgi:hypothetical protein